MAVPRQAPAGGKPLHGSTGRSFASSDPERQGEVASGAGRAVQGRPIVHKPGSGPQQGAPAARGSQAPRIPGQRKSERPAR